MQKNGSPVINEETAKQELERFRTAPEWNQLLAEGKAQILDSIRNNNELKGYKQSAGDEIATVLYAEKSLPGVDEWVYRKIPKMAPATIRRWRSSYKKSGLSGLLTEYGTRKGQQRAVTPEMRIFIISLFKVKPGIRKSHIHKIIQKKFPDCPDRKTLSLFIDNWKAENIQLATIIEDPRKWKNTMMPAFGDKAAGITYFCHTWEIDSTPADIMTSDGKRCAIIGLIDVFSRRSRLFIAPTSKSTAIAACLREALISWGIPDCIRMDNGNDYSSRHIEAVTSSLQIHTPKLPPYTPEAKPFIERFFGTYSQQLEELLPGYCGHSVAERQKIREQETWASKIMKRGEPVEVPLTMQEFKDISDRWIRDYETTQHGELGGLTPLEAAERSKIHPQKIRDHRVLDILLAPVSEPRKVGKKGISIDGSYYISPELVEHVGRRVQARYDLQDAGIIYVFDASKGTFLCEARNEALEGKTLEEYNAAKKRHKRELKEKAAALNTLGLTQNTALEILLGDDLLHAPKKVIPFQGEADNETIREARRAVTGEQEDHREPSSVPAQVVPMRSHTSNPADNSWMTEEDLDKEYERAVKKFAK